MRKGDPGDLQGLGFKPLPTRCLMLIRRALSAGALDQKISICFHLVRRIQTGVGGFREAGWRFEKSRQTQGFRMCFSMY